jgi:hypothetical protein
MRCVQLWKNSINVLWMNTLKNEGYMDNFERLWLICGQFNHSIEIQAKDETISD